MYMYTAKPCKSYPPNAPALHLVCKYILIINLNHGGDYFERIRLDR